MADPKNLFTTDGREEWTEESRALDQELCNAITPIIKKWQDAGYSKRQIHYVLMMAAHDVGANLVCGFLI